MRTQVESVDWIAVTAEHSLSDTIFLPWSNFMSLSLQEKSAQTPS